MDIRAFDRFQAISGQEAYEGDLGERFHAVINQNTFVEVCTCESTSRGHYWIGHIGALKEHVYDLAEFNHKLRTQGLYYVLKTEDDVKAFLGGVTAQMVFDRP
jgi:hypothetical protein